jgi:hypothetical protein
MAPAAKRSKYGAVKTVVNGITFASKREAARYVELKRLEEAGEIRDLRLQPSFEIIPAVELDGKKQRAIKYIADFSFLDADGVTVYEDVKGMRTQVYQLKRKLVKHVFGVEIREVR